MKKTTLLSIFSLVFLFSMASACANLDGSSVRIDNQGFLSK
jgi:hypothetical protein